MAPSASLPGRLQVPILVVVDMVMEIELNTILAGVEPTRLAQLIDLEAECRQKESSDLLREAWADQLAVVFEFEMLKAAADDLEMVGTAAPRTIRELMLHPYPKEEWFRWLKLYAQQHRQHPSSPMPLKVAMMLYYLSIVLALVRCHVSISSLSDDNLATGVDWALTQDWIDPTSRQLFIQAAA
jgi:hypothetical protein